MEYDICIFKYIERVYRCIKGLIIMCNSVLIVNS